MPVLGRIFLALLLILSLAGAANAEDSVKRLEALPISIGHAIRIVEREAVARALSADLGEEHDGTVWNVFALNDRGMSEYRVDATSGRLIRVVEAPLRGRLYRLLFDLGLDDIKGMKIGPSEAIRRAEQEIPGRAMAMALDRPKSRIEYLVVVRTARGLHRVRVDGDTGEIVYKN